MNHLNHIAYYCKGDTHNKQTIYSILTLLNVYNNLIPENYRIVIYTDKPESFSFLEEKAPIITRRITDADLNKWLNSSPNFLRSKICVMQDFLSNNTGKMLYVDTDTVFLKRIETIFDTIDRNKSFMHKKEGAIAGKVFEDYLKVFGGRKFTLKSSGRQIEINENSCMWNSGVIGLSSENAGLVTEALELCDELEKISFLYLIEQFSLSVILTETNQVKNAHKHIFHYWPSDFKIEMNNYLSKVSFPKEGKEIDEVIKKVTKNNILRTNVLQKVLFHFSPKNFTHFFKYRLPHLFKLE